MNDEKGTLQLVAENLALALEPLGDAVQDADSFQTFLYGLGWNVTDLPPSYAALGALVDDTLALLEELDTSPDPAEIVELLGKVKDVHAAVEGLTEVPSGADAGTFLAEFAERLFEFLLARYLAIALPSIYHALRLLGVILLQAFPETPTRPAFVRTQIDYDAIPDMIADPASIPKRVYGWGTNSLDFDLIAGQLQDLLLAIGLPAALEQVEPELAEGYQDPTKTEEVIGRRVKVIFLGTTIGDVPVELALAVLPYPAEDSKSAGLIIQPDVPEELGLDYELTDSLKFSLRAGTNVASLFGVIVRPGEIIVRYPFQPGTTLPSAGFGAALDYAPAATRTLLGVPDATRLQVAGARFALDLDDRAGKMEFRLAAETHELALVLESSDEDSFLQKVLGGGTHQFPVPLAIVWSSRTGFGFGDGGSLEFAFAPHLQLGPVRVETLKIGMRGGRVNGNAALTTEIVVDVSGALGPVAFSAEDIGAQLKLVFAAGNAGPFDIAVGFRPPTGLGLEVDAAAITGGGFLFFDNDKKQYAGVLELSLENRIQLKVIGILNTILPGGQQGFSLLLIITAEFEPMQLGFGFTLNGVGGLAGINRTMLIDVLRAGLRNRTLDSILFPPDPIQNAPKIISDLSAVFPPLEGRYAFGPQLKIGWGTPTLIRAAVGVFIELPPPIRLAILAQIKAALPNEKSALIEINMDAIGTYEEEKKRLELDRSPLRIHENSLQERREVAPCQL